MKRLLFASLCLGAFMSGGCYVSLQPLGSDKDLVFEAGLIGTWVEKDMDEQDTWVFKAGDPSTKKYEVEITERARPFSGAPARSVQANFLASLVRIDDLRILDVTPGDNSSAWPALKDHGMLATNLVAVHSFFLVRLDKDTLTLLAMDDEWIDAAIAARTLSVAHEHIGDDPNPHEAGQADLHRPRSSKDQSWVLLTAPSSQLQEVVRKYGRAGLFAEKDPRVFVRQR